jgi:Calcium binding
MRDISDIPEIPERATRLAEITVDCYGREEELSAFEVYLSDALRLPFAATWRDPDEPGFSEPVVVGAVADLDERRGILLQVRRRGGKARRVLAEQIWANETAGPNAIVLDDYRFWVEHGGLDLEE